MSMDRECEKCGAEYDCRIGVKCPACGSFAAPSGSVRRVELPRRITDKWTRERTDAELRWLAKDFQGSCNGQRFDAEIRRRKEALNNDSTQTR